MTEPRAPSTSEPMMSVLRGEPLAALALGDADEPLHMRFARHAAARPDAIAARCGDVTLTYAALAARADALAHTLHAEGVRAETMVAVCVAPSLEVLVAILAIFKVGAVYVPLDPSHPPALIAEILAEVRAQVVLADAGALGVLPGDAPVLRVDVPRLPPAPAVALPRVCLDHAAYVLYTSGTTGRPKGVVATHRNLAHYLGVARARFGFAASDVFVSLARYTFSISFFELLSPLAVGASVVLLPRDVVLDAARLSEVLDGGVTVVHAGPSLLASLFRYARKHGRAFPTLRHASTGGDLVPPHVLEEMRIVFPRAERFVLYGCTEVSCMGTFHEVPACGAIARTLVGWPFADVTVRVVDEAGAVTARGEVGEVCFAGKGIARRYLARPELTSERFVCIDGERFYRTGDVARMHPDGALELLGRRDFQVQLRGIRVELGGVEHTLVALGLAAQAVVTAVRRSDEDVRLVAFVVDAPRADLATIRRALAQRLPDYMLPHAVCALPALPLTANGKVDRRALAALAAEATASAPRAASEPIRDPGEHAIAEAFARVLGVSSVGRDDDFFALGGHSLTAVLLLSDLEDRLGIRLAPSVLFEHGTVRALAAAARGEARAEQRPILLSERADRPALFMLLGVHLYRELARELEGAYAVYGVYAARELALIEGHADAPSIAELAREYVAILRRQQPHGPYRIGGMSFGGIVAYEVAQQLQDAGEVVESLLLLDAVLPQAGFDKLRRLAALPGRRLVRELAARLRARLGPGRVAIDASFLAHHDDAALRDIELQRQAAYRAAALAYRAQMRPFDGETTLIVAGERLAEDRLQDPRCGFGVFARNLRVHTFAADHLGLLAAPTVADVASALRHELLRTPLAMTPARASNVPALRVAAG